MAKEKHSVLSAVDRHAEMERVSSLITDMTIKGADSDELACAVRHSTIIFDEEKRPLHWRQSEIDNGISLLQEKYQGKNVGEAS